MGIGGACPRLRPGVNVVEVHDGGGARSVERLDRIPVVGEPEVEQSCEEQAREQRPREDHAAQRPRAEHPAEDQVSHHPAQQPDVHAGDQRGEQPVGDHSLGGCRVEKKSVRGRFGYGDREEKPHPAAGGRTGSDVVGDSAHAAEAGELLRGSLGPDIPGVQPLAGGLHVREGRPALPFPGGGGLDPDRARPRLVLRRPQPAEGPVRQAANSGDPFQEPALGPAFSRRGSGGRRCGNALARLLLGGGPFRSGEGGVGHIGGAGSKRIERCEVGRRFRLGRGRIRFIHRRALAA